MSLNVNKPEETSLRARIKIYCDKANEIKSHLEQFPQQWGKFQSEFNQEINFIFRDLMIFEKENLAKGQEEKVYKLKNLFIKRFRQEFVYGQYVKHSLEKPYGYAGDFEIIDNIYRNDPQTVGFDRLFDNYAQMSAVALSIRNRKEDFKKMILSYLKSNNSKHVRIMDLASGPCRDLAELFWSGGLNRNGLIIDCYDQDPHAIRYAKNILSDYAQKVCFVQENAVKLALKRNIENQMIERYDLIYSTGLFDYLDHRIAVRLVANLKKLLKQNGQIIIANVQEKYQNPSVYFLEWVGDWGLIYRSQKEFKQIFLDAGFEEKQLQVTSEQQGIIQYVIGTA